MAVEVVAVVEVAIAGGRLADGLGDLVDREVVERARASGLLVRRARRASRRAAGCRSGRRPSRPRPGNTPVESSSFITRVMIDGVASRRRAARTSRGARRSDRWPPPTERSTSARSGQAGQARDVEGLVVVAIEQEVPGEVLHRVAGRHHLPVEHGGDLLVGAEDHVADAGVAPAQGGAIGRRRRDRGVEELEGPVDDRVRHVAARERAVLAVELELLGGRRRHRSSRGRRRRDRGGGSPPSCRCRSPTRCRCPASSSAGTQPSSW